MLLAKNLTGYKNLIKLTSIAHLEGFYYKPRVDWETLKKHADGLVAMSACLAGEIPRLIIAGKKEKARERIKEYRALFGEENFYLEIQPHAQIEEQILVNRELIAIGREFNVPLVATNDVHYLRPEDHDVQDVLLCLQTKSKRDDEQRMRMDGRDFYLKSGREMSEAFPEAPDAIENTVKIAAACDLDLELGKIQLPYFAVPDGFDGVGYLTKLARAGIEKRYGLSYEKAGEEIKKRLDYEIEVIAKMGWPSYFLIVADFVNWAKDNRIVVGPGRGSAAGSLVCYLTGITNIDPLKYDLLFERFLNPDRISMPDIDMDFADIRRDDVIRYVEDKYGHDRVAQIITFGTMAARAAVRDVGRVLGYPYDYCDRLAKMIPMFTDIDQALKTVAELKDIYRQEEGARKIIDYARRLEGVARHASTHACGVVITKEEITEHLPLQYASSSDRSIVSQYSLHPIEDLGLLKMDFLGLKNLTIIESAIKIIKNTRGIEINIETIPLDDPAAYALFQKGETTGVFQFESSGMKRYLKELKPTEFEDIIAMVALYRPGPMEWIPDYIAGKHGKKKPAYLHPKLEPILKRTYGVAIYQEQVMQMARDLAGFTMAEADVLRKAVGKKIPKLLAEQKEKFVDGCVKNGIASQLAEKIFSFIEPFAGYGFNRSHAACYAMIAYETAYLKSHWPAEFMAALLTSDQGDTDRIAIEIGECRRMGLTVTSPDINESYDSFTVVTSGTAENRSARADEEVKTIRFGLKAVKNIGEHIAEYIIAERKAGGPFPDLANFLTRVGDKDLNKKSLESLVKCGALDKFGERGNLLLNMDGLLEFHKEIHKAKNNRQTSLFADAPAINSALTVKLRPTTPAGRQEKLGWEKELLGLYLSEHPITDFQPILAGAVTAIKDLRSHLEDSSVTAAGVITKVQKIMTRSNETMLFVKIEDLSGGTEVLVFPSLLKESAAVWLEGKVALIQGRVSDKDQEIKILANRAAVLELKDAGETIKKFLSTPRPFNGYAKNGAEKKAPSFYQRPAGNTPPAPSTITLLITENLNEDVLDGLRKLLLSLPGSAKVFFEFNNGSVSQKIATPFLIGDLQILKIELARMFKGRIKIANN
jgi:DNA polymerase III subunit alpha